MCACVLDKFQAQVPVNFEHGRSNNFEVALQDPSNICLGKRSTVPQVADDPRERALNFEALTIDQQPELHRVETHPLHRTLIGR